MAVSTLNPHAPLFVPSAFLAAEDFSPDWWRLVHTCPAFREYWIKECSDSYQDPQLPSDLDIDLDLEFHLDPDFYESLFSDGDDLEDSSRGHDSSALDDRSRSSSVPPWPSPLKSHNVPSIPSVPLLPRAVNVDVHVFDVKADLRELATSKQRKQQFMSPSPPEKVPQIVASPHRKSSARKIQQPR